MSRPSPFLQGAFAPVHTEETALELEITGTLPPELDGLFTQIGPTPVRPPKNRSVDSYQWFTQDGMVSGVRICDGRASWFRNRWIRSRHAARALGEAKAPGPRHFPMDMVHTNVIAHNGLLLALVETGCLPARLSSELGTVEYTDLGGRLPRGFSAHPKLDPVTGELHLLASSPLRRWAEYLVLGPDSSLRHQQRIPLGGRPMLHDIALTARHLLCFDTPVQFTAPAAIRGGFPYRWQEGRPTRLGVLPRPGVPGQPRWFTIPDCFVFHTVSAHEPVPGQLELLAIRYPRLFNGATEDFITGVGTLWRWQVDLDTGRVSTEQVDDRPHELPRSDPGKITQRLRHYYAITAESTESVTSHQPDSLLHHDLFTGRQEIRKLPAGHAAAEPVYIPHPTRDEEEAGWVVYFEYDGATDTSNLVWLNAGDFTGLPLATVRLPIRVPMGCHSSWIGATDITHTDEPPRSWPPRS